MLQHMHLVAAGPLQPGQQLNWLAHFDCVSCTTQFDFCSCPLSPLNSLPACLPPLSSQFSPSVCAPSHLSISPCVCPLSSHFPPCVCAPSHLPIFSLCAPPLLSIFLPGVLRRGSAFLFLMDCLQAQLDAHISTDKCALTVVSSMLWFCVWSQA